MEYPSWIGGSYRSQAFTADAERTVNWYVEKMEQRGPTTKGALYPTPGVTLLTTATSGPGRAHFAEAGREFIVAGVYFFEFGSDSTISNINTVALDEFPATITSNGAGQLFITSGGSGYSFDLTTNVFSTVANLANKARMGGMLDGWSVALDTITSTTTPTLYISDLSDSTTWDPTRFIQRSAASDPFVSVKVSKPYIYLLGERTSEVWYNAGTSPVPFALYTSARISYGCAAPFSAAVVEGSLIWLSQTEGGIGAVVRAGGTAPEIISTYPVQKAISGYATISDAVADTYSEMGHTFYVLHFPSADATWVYDVQSQVWHERGTWISEQSRYGIWRPRYHAYVFGQHRMLDAQNGSIYKMSVDIALDVDSRPIRRLRQAPALVEENERVVFSSFELDLERGQGLITGQGSDPKVMLRMSNDRGQTWGNEMQMSAGKIGEYHVRVRRNRCGQARGKVFEVTVSDVIPWRLTNAYLGVHPAGGQGQPPPQGQQ